LALSDPQSITINAIANSLPRTANVGTSSTYTKDDGTVVLSIAHSNGKRNRRKIGVKTNKFSADPYLPAANQKVGMEVYLVTDTPITGYTNAEAKQVIDGFLAYLSASSGAKITQLLGGES
jgi:hypothetical protein